METNIYEIAGVINECFYYLNRIEYQSKQLFSIDKTYLNLPRSTYEENIKFEREMRYFLNKCRKRQVNLKPLFTQLILDMNYLFKFSLFSDYSQKLKCGDFVRLKRGKEVKVTNLKAGITFFRDAITHPEHETDDPSPRSWPEFPDIKINHYGAFFEEDGNTCFQIGKGKISFAADIRPCFKNLKKICLENDNKNILADFKWQK